MTKSKPSKQKLLTATLELVGTEGLSGVTFRAVASKADLPLGLTSYYFKNKDEMLTEAYYLFHQSSMVPVNEFIESISQFFSEDNAAANTLNLGKDVLVERLTVFTTNYIKTQVVKNALDRKIAAAFMHAGIVNPMIRELVAERQQNFIDTGSKMLMALGVSEPKLVSSMFLSLTNHVEKQLMLENRKRFNQKYVEQVFNHFFNLIL
ncbi:HTH-type transcriptional regulator RcdA [Thalassocella blandensis]|nr:HTH-type transcriptional regulator RcdA [Thalassocella blandensis]